MTRLATKIEAVLYLKGQPLSLVDITKCVNCEIEAVQDAIIELMSDYAYRDSALEVVETKNGYSLQLRSVFNDLTNKIIPAELGKAVLRTLAAIILLISYLKLSNKKIYLKTYYPLLTTIRVICFFFWI